MHELGTISYVIRTVERIAREQKLTRIASVTLEVGEVSGIIPAYLTDYWRYARGKTELLRETELKIETLPAVTFCEGCGETYPTVQYAKRCPHCGGERTWLLTGNEYNIKEIEAM